MMWEQERLTRSERDSLIKQVHAELAAIACARSELDARELRLLRELKRLEMWRDLGYATAFEYLETELGYTPRMAYERLKIAEALAELPNLEAALAANELHLSAVRELSRVATPDTEEEWLDKAIGLNLREVEQLVCGHKYGDRPDDPPDPKLRRRTLTFADILPETDAMLRQARIAAATEHAGALDDNAMLQLLLRTYLSGAAPDDIPRPAYQMTITTCRRCKASAQVAGGRVQPVDRATVACAACDAIELGDVEGPPERATSTVTPRLREQVFQRDKLACTVPGCRATRNLAIHHIEHQEHGGKHQLSNLTLLCFAHHKMHHDGRLDISGEAPDRLTFRWRPRIVPAANPRG